MSFLRRMFSGKAKKDDPRRFLIEAMLGAMEADGEVLNEEMEVLQKNLEEHELFEGLSGEETARLVDMAADAIRDAGGGHKRVANLAKGLPSRGHRLTAYAMACEVCVSDAELPEAEIKYLEALQEALELDTEEAQDLFEAARGQSGLMTLEEKTVKMRELMPRFVDCMALMAAADGEVHEEERVGIRAVLRNSPDMAVLTGDELDGAIDDAFNRVEGKTADKGLAVVAETITNNADRYWTTVYMMIIALADGKTDWREVAFLKTAETTFELSDVQMDRAMETARLFPAIELGGSAPA
jgi:uncharacterized tellurite resistance protein B-like protein